MLPAHISTFLCDAETIDAEYIKMGERIEQGIVGASLMFDSCIITRNESVSFARLATKLHIR
ncbi:hypothetical protein BDE02_12G004100 [Populus trichocarpa]|nr:hypothetical protein BDE02_12G004100 [Populus trichocarpa]